MNLMLGNLNVSQIEERLGVNFPQEIREFMAKTHEPNANNIPVGKWHCFDIPFNLVCGDIETATKIYNSLKDSKVIKQRLQFSISSQS